MTDQTVDVGAIRPVVTAWSPEDSKLERWASAPHLGWDVFATTPDTAGPPSVASVASVGAMSHPLLAPADTWTSKLAHLARRASVLGQRRRADLWVVVECLAVAVAGIVTMTVLGAYGPASWVALGGAICVAMQTRSQMHSASHLEVLPVLRSLAVAFAGAAVLSALDLASNGELAVAAGVLLVAGAVIFSALVLRQGLRRPLRVVVVGDRAAISRAAMRWADGTAHVIGGVLPGDEESRLQSIVGVPTIVGLEHAADWAHGRRADLVVVAPSKQLAPPQLRSLGWSLERTGIAMAVADAAGDAAPHRVRARRLGRTTLIELTPSRPGAIARLLKSAIDRLVGAVLLACASPFLAVTMLMIRLDSRGAPLFKQERVGQDGRTFTLYKLRTMRSDAERQLVALREHNEGAGVLFKMRQDPRVTRLGKLLRRTSMDELPQLINVVKGNMSLVGPRPALPAEVAEYDDVERRRLAVKPGMTGLWQVSGRSNLDWETSIGLDLDYVDNWRIGDDLMIGLRTIGAVTGARGAY
ncbi:MAG TPA: sugar transferase [Nocardioides sp.]|uniref:sugar transferase n=1 Tax=Nocardioides sp. TaxID=35761 RepID=UPI002E30A360|nr:sugar transferase [Nocardioides sp.]HEX3930856.1 sugar transferase [Nocardioides sp.]